MVEVIIYPLVESKLENLIFTLYKKEYFGFLDSALAYVAKIRETMYTIPEQKHHKTKNSRYGKWFVTHKTKNRRTQYKITFDKMDDRYIIKNIITSHESGYPKYIRGSKQK